jgi:hypothetical protein
MRKKRIKFLLRQDVLNAIFHMSLIIDVQSLKRLSARGAHRCATRVRACRLQCAHYFRRGRACVPGVTSGRKNKDILGYLVRQNLMGRKCGKRGLNKTYLKCDLSLQHSFFVACPRVDGKKRILRLASERATWPSTLNCVLVLVLQSSRYQAPSGDRLLKLRLLKMEQNRFLHLVFGIVLRSLSRSFC